MSFFTKSSPINLTYLGPHGLFLPLLAWLPIYFLSIFDSNLFVVVADSNLWGEWSIYVSFGSVEAIFISITI